jgi:hypothetical protein
VTTKQVIYSWPSFRKPLTLHVAATIDGQAIPVRWLDASHRRVAISAATPSWTNVELALTLVTPEQIPPDLDLGIVNAHALLTAPSSVTRIPAALTRQGEAWTGVLNVSRDEVRGSAELIAAFTTDDGSALGRVVGEAEPWTVVFDPSPGPVGRGLSPLTIIWTSFSSPPAEMPSMLADFKSSLSFCDTGKADPILYLNEDVAGLRNLLDNEKAVGLAAATRDTLGALIALDAVAALCDAAVGAVRRQCEGSDDDEPEFLGLDNPVHEAVLMELVDHVDFAINYDDLCRQIMRAESAADPNEIVLLSSKLRACAQGIVAARKHTEDLAKKVLDA